MIRTENLTKLFKTEEIETLALKDINIAIESGEFVSIVGPSGSGKTTLLNILGLIDKSSSGKYWFQGTEVCCIDDFQRSILRKGKIGYIFRDFNLIDDLTVYENIELPLIYLRIGSHERKVLVNKMLDRMRIGYRRANFPRQLSGIQQQRVAIARALVTSPALVLADEPAGKLDSVAGTEVMNLLAEINSEGTTIIMATHSATDADKANRVVQLFDGSVLSEKIAKAI